MKKKHVIQEEPEGKKRNKPNIFSQIFICWVCPVLFTGNRRDVEESDLIVPGKKYDSDRQGYNLQKYWDDELDNYKEKNITPSLWRAIRRCYWLAYMPAAILLIVNITARTLQPMVFTRLLGYWSAESGMELEEAAIYAGAMLGLNIIAMMCYHHNTLFINRFSLKVKVACTSLLYRKLLRLSQVSIGDVAAGKLVNLMSNDVSRFDYAFMFLHQLWLIPLQAAVVLYFLYIAAGYAPFVGLFSVIILILPVQAGLTKLTAILRRKTAMRTDKRIKLMSEIINGIQVLKMYAWEKPFQAVVNAARAFEMAAARNAFYVRSIFLGFMLFTDRTTIYLTVLVLALTGNMITATTIYPIQQYFSIIQMNMTMIFPFAIANLSEMLVSCERIQEFLFLDEKDDYAPDSGNDVSNNKEKTKETDEFATSNTESYKSSVEPSSGLRKSITPEHAIELSNVSASWTNSKDNLTLKNIALRIGKGKFCAIVGPVGSGKSSLLQVLLNELPVCEGNLKVNGTVSYACQESWLFPATVRDNILFGLPYEQKKYKEVCKACCLEPDFKQFPYADQSLVGDRGVSLSGGQRARINLARAVYRDADIYILDDPLSAVDANVGRKLFEGCINGYLRGRTCILVTHQIHFLGTAKFIVVLNEGKIDNFGSYDELMHSDREFSQLFLSLEEGVGGDEEQNEKRPSLMRKISKISIKSEDNPEEQKAQVQEAEARAKGNMKWEVLGRYLSCVKSWLIVFLALLSILITQAVATGVDYWLSFWTNQVDQYEQGLPASEEPDPALDTFIGPWSNGVFLITHGCLVLAVIILTQVRIFTFVSMSTRASINIHNLIFVNLIRTTMRFFDTNNSGRVLNRFSKDMGAMDELLPRSFLETLQMYLSIASILVLNAIALPWTLIPTTVLLTLFFFLLRWYLNAAQAVKRLEGTTKSPVFGMINSTISGLSTIRSSNSQERLMKTFDDAQNMHSSAYYTFIGGAAAFGLYLDIICLLYLGTILAIFLLVDFGEFIPVGSIGLAVSQSMVLTMILQMAARFTADTLAQMTSVERVLEYSKLPFEEHIDDGPTQPPKDWPSNGKITFQNVFLKYGQDDPPVLKGLNFEVESGWKIGVVGRTGAGKSSLISALFRLYNIDGDVRVDGINTRGIAKQMLRAKISIIPQEPILFSATVRYNLDPFNHFSDEEIWRALEQVELKDAIPALDFKVSEGGSNFSVGQRQLVCLARAVLRSNKILVMDEATANVDPQTDALIQKTIRREFTSCTMLTIAHRLNTVMDSDRVLVMDKGVVAEYDHPYNLLSNSNSALSSMVKETGENMSKTLFEMAKTKYLSDQQKDTL